MADSRSGNLWAITCYFNPVGYRRRLENYRMFRQRLKVPLVAVELSFDEKFQLAFRGCRYSGAAAQLLRSFGKRSACLTWR